MQFSFHERDKQMFVRKAEKIEKVIEAVKKEREFKANPMPDLHRAPALPTKEAAEPTQAKPFNLEVTRRRDDVGSQNILSGYPFFINRT